MSATSPPRRPVIDVSRLPPYAFGMRDPLYFGIVFVMAIEGLGFALLVASYLYVRGNQHVWPPSTIGTPATAGEAVATALLLLSGVTVLAASRATRKKNLRGMQVFIVLSTVLGLVALAARAWALPRVQFRWNSHAYGSVFWALLFMHTLHAVFGTMENGVFSVLLLKGPIEEKHLADVDVNCLYWLFVVVTWLLLFPLLYLEPFVFPK